MIMRARFNSGKIQELLRLHWFDVKTSNTEQELKRETENSSQVPKSKRGNHKKPEVSENPSLEQNVKDPATTADQLIQQLYQKKLKNFNKHSVTRESKVNLKKDTS